jgi:hypothetical protein
MNVMLSNLSHDLGVSLAYSIDREVCGGADRIWLPVYPVSVGRHDLDPGRAFSHAVGVTFCYSEAMQIAPRGRQHLGAFGDSRSVRAPCRRAECSNALLSRLLVERFRSLTPGPPALYATPNGSIFAAPIASIGLHGLLIDGRLGGIVTSDVVGALIPNPAKD